MWTAKLLVYMERFALSAITAQWYFHRNDPSTTINNPPWKSALIKASTTSFGTLAFGSLILAIIQFLQFVARSIRKYSKTARPFAAVLSFILRYIDALVSTFSNYTISLAGITGESFCSAATSATKIFRRNLLTGLFGGKLKLSELLTLKHCYWPVKRRSFDATHLIHWSKCDCIVVRFRCLCLCHSQPTFSSWICGGTHWNTDALVFVSILFVYHDEHVSGVFCLFFISLDAEYSTLFFSQHWC